MKISSPDKSLIIMKKEPRNLGHAAQVQDPWGGSLLKELRVYCIATNQMQDKNTIGCNFFLNCG